MNSIITDDLNDEALVRLAQKGSLEAFIALYDRFLPIVYRRVRYMVPERDVSAVTQEIFFTLIRSLKDFRGDTLFTNWLRTLVRSQVMDYYRCRPPDVSDTDLGKTTSRANRLRIEESKVSYDERRVLRRAIRKLPEKYSEILLLRLAEGLRFYEIAHLQGQSLEATKSLFWRAVTAMHRHLEENHAKEAV